VIGDDDGSERVEERAELPDYETHHPLLLFAAFTFTFTSQLGVNNE
jgi:hypothetical protein